MSTRSFHITDVLSITDGRLLSLNGIGGVYGILNFMTGDNLYTHQLPRASQQCNPYLLAQFPVLGDSQLKTAIDHLCEMLGTETGRKDSNSIIKEWLLTLKDSYGVDLPETLDVIPIPDGEYAPKGVIEELLEMTGSKKPIHVISAES